MTNKFSLHFPLTNRVITLEHIKSGSNTNSQNAYENQVIEFCTNWMLGQETFKQYSSGSTGQAKLIVLERQKMIWSAQQTNAFFNLNNGSKFLLCLDPNYVGGKMMLVRAMEVGATVVVVPPSSTPFEYLDGAPFTFAAMVPMQIETCLGSDAGVLFLQSIENIIVGGGPLSTPAQSQLAQFNNHSYATYGMTETVSHIALKPINELLNQQPFIILGDVQIKASNEGTLMVQSKITDNQWLTTTDIVELLSSNQFFWRGRKDFIINSGGIKLNPETIENEIIQLLPTTTEALSLFVGSLPDKKLGRAAVLVVQGVWSEKWMEHLLHIRPKFKKHNFPKQVLFMKSLPHTQNGKINRIELNRLILTKAEEIITL